MYFFIVVAYNEVSSQLSNYISVIIGEEGTPGGTPLVSGY
ncbi:MAG: hypothetical protein Lokiarch_49730 [Candidatus Lokiarchaeum sp. GC14_75]|nr:MAG: hypothetical protein Lokiarch_49730 [Candidatus Lokiarchaeum sp. GC14_75]